MAKRMFAGIIVIAFAVCTVATARQANTIDATRIGEVEVRRTEPQFVRGSRAFMIPWHINYQGYLTDDSGNPINDTLSMTFGIWDAASGGTEVWNEPQNVEVRNGLFNLILGTVNSIPTNIFSSGDSRWLELTVDAQTLSPRTEITSVGYAYRAVKADSSESADMVDGFDASATPGPNELFPQSYGDGRYVNEGQADAVTSSMILDGTLLRSDVDLAFKAPYADTADYALNVLGDGDWEITGNVLHPAGEYALAMRSWNVLHGTNSKTHVNLGIDCTTGRWDENYAYCTVSGGLENWADGDYATVGGGYNNMAEWSGSTIGGGRDNMAGDYGVVGGGFDNIAGGYSAVGGGESNRGWGQHAFVGGGWVNEAFSGFGTIGGGSWNVSAGDFSFIGGGAQNEAIGEAVTISGGILNLAGDTCATVCGGRENVAAAVFATVCGGREDTVAGKYSLAAGRLVRIDTTADYTFAFGRDFRTSTPNAVIFHNSVDSIRVGIGNTAPTHLLDVGTDGAYCDGGVWIDGSSRNYKEHIVELTLEEAVEAVDKLTPVTYNYKSNKNERHVGFIAEDVPELVATKDRNGLSPMDVVATLTKVVQYQQEAIKKQQEEIQLLKETIAEIDR